MLGLETRLQQRQQSVHMLAKEIARVLLVVSRCSFLLHKAVESKCEHAGSLLSQLLTVVGNQDLS